MHLTKLRSIFQFIKVGVQLVETSVTGAAASSSEISGTQLTELRRRSVEPGQSPCVYQAALRDFPNFFLKCEASKLLLDYIDNFLTLPGREPAGKS